MSTRPLIIACAAGFALTLAAPHGTARAGDSCMYDGTKYSEGALSCQAGKRYQCDDGEWESKGEHCTAAAADSPQKEDRVIRKKTEVETEERN